jgi:hypothetical protein
MTDEETVGPQLTAEEAARAAAWAGCLVQDARHWTAEDEALVAKLSLIAKGGGPC